MSIEADEELLAEAKAAKGLLIKDADRAAILLSKAAEKAAALLIKAAMTLEADQPSKVLLSKAAEDAKALLNEAARTAEVLLGTGVADAVRLLNKAAMTAELLIARVKRLEGIIPICSYCKRIRDDQNCWNQLEQYLSDHSDALFSHGICPHCMKEHRPNIQL